MTISPIPTFNTTSFLVLTIVGLYLVGRQCNSRICFTYEICNLPDGIQSWDLLHCKPLLYQQLKEISTQMWLTLKEDRYGAFLLQNIELSCITFCSLFEESISQFAISQSFIFCMLKLDYIHMYIHMYDLFIHFLGPGGSMSLILLGSWIT